MPISPDQKEKLKSLGNRVRTLRLERGLTLKDLAYKIEKDPQSIQRLEAGGVNPSFLYLQDICAGLDVSVHFLIKPL